LRFLLDRFAVSEEVGEISFGDGIGFEEEELEGW